LPEALRGLKLLHISDIHVGPYISLSDLEALVDRARSLQPDLVFVSGDICDHLPSYLDSLRILEQLRPTHGTYASLGNHKYFRGIEAVRSSFEKSDIPLLVDDGIALKIDGEKIFVSGADDPRHMGGPESTAKLRRSVEESQKKADGMGFRILMSHRSVAFDTAAELGVDLTLSGHTHGFQLGMGGRSLFDSSYPDRYIWGQYEKGERRLYTSAGVGHWLPFRLGSPPEAPLIVLEKS
jgi:predicted MPP superfamily phosphohydrolase